MMNHHVDVIVPIYGACPWLAETIESVLAQTYTRWHLTLVDDGSPDGPADVARAYAARLPARITLIALYENRGPAGVRMAAIRQTCGDLVALLDHDDRWHPDYLATQVQALDALGVDAMHCAATLIDDAGARIAAAPSPEDRLCAAFPWQSASREETMRFVGLKGMPLVPATLLRRAALEGVGGLSEGFFGGEEWSFWMRFAARYRIGYTPQPLIDRRLHGTNTSRRRVHDRLRDWVRATQQIAAEYPSMAGLCRQRCLQTVRRTVRIELEEGLTSDVTAHTALLLRLAPLDPRSWYLWAWARCGSTGMQRAVERLYRGGRRLLWANPIDRWHEARAQGHPADISGEPHLPRCTQRQ